MSKFALRARNLPGDSGISLTSEVGRLRPCLEQTLHDVMRFLPVEKLQMKVAAGGIGESLEELPSQPKAERGGHVLGFFL